MNRSHQSNRIRTVIVYICAFVTILVSLAVLAGWAADIDFLKSLSPDLPKMKPNTAAAFFLAGTGLWLAIWRGAGTVKRYASFACGILVFLIGFLTLIEYSSDTALGIDTFLTSAAEVSTEGVWAGRMSPHAAVNFVLTGMSLALLAGRRSFQKVSEYLILLVPISTYMVLLGHIYGAEQLYGISKYNSMALHTAALFFIGSVGLLTANPRSGTVRLLSSGSLGGTAARRLVPAVIFIPTILGWLRVVGQNREMFDTGFGTAMTIFITVALMVAIVLFYSGAVHKADMSRKQAEQELADKELRYRELFDYGQGMICLHSLDGTLITVNRAILGSLGYGLDEMAGKNLVTFMPPDHRPLFASYLREVESQGLASGLLSLLSKSGEPVVWRYTNILVSETGKEAYVIGSAQDVTELLKAQKALKSLSLTDELTGLYNRRGFQTLSEQQIKLERHEGTARGLTIMFADMDGLKHINDVHGHEAGSDSIAQFAAILKSSVRMGDVVGRWGGDEFVILTIGSQTEGPNIMSSRINDKIDEYNLNSDKPYKIACSIGIAPIDPNDTRTLESIIDEADKAMYAEKQRRRETAALKSAETIGV